ncbi:MAG TPA: MauE/DoxX family redox-associated membrane protein [Terrimicrobiaceae bacterium]
MKQTAFLIRLGLAGVFLYSGLVKASASAQFAIALTPFTLIPQTWLGPLSILLPLLEIACGALILAPRTKRIGAGLIFGLCLVFVTVLGWALANGIIVSCSCFGQDEQPSAAKMTLAIVRDVLLAGLALAVLFLERPLPGSA